MSLVSRQVGEITVASLHGSVDASTIRAMEPDLLALAETDGARIAVDLNGVTTMDSSGLGMLLALTKRARAHSGHVVLFGMPPSVQALVRVTGINRVIRTVEAESDALSLLER